MYEPKQAEQKEETDPVSTSIMELLYQLWTASAYPSHCIKLKTPFLST
jgi:hypothetical protein